MSIYTGDVSDDDADVINRLVQQNAEPPSPQELPQVPGIHVPVADYRPKRPTRLLTGTFTFLSTTPAQQILWRDDNRTGLTLFVYSATATDSVSLAEDNSKTGGSGSTQQSASVNAQHDPIRLDGYTGPLWLAGEAGTVKVSWIAITS